MNERNIIIVAVLILVGLSFFSYYDDLTGQAMVKGRAECKYLTDTSIHNPTMVGYDALVTDEIPAKIWKSSCASATSVTNVGCRDGRHAVRFVTQCPDDHKCVDKGRGGYCELGSVGVEEGNCIDSDGGDPYTRGTVIVKAGRGHNPETAIDQCATELTVSEKVCAPKGNNIETKIMRCPYPYTCKGGACKN